MSRTQRLLVVFGLLISLLFLWIAFSRLDLAVVFESIVRVHPLPLIVAAVVYYFGAVTVITQRWNYLLRSVKPVSVQKLMPLVVIGYMGNNVYPFRSGEILRIWLLQRNYKVPATRALATVIVERIFDGLVMLTFIVVALLNLNISSPEAREVLDITAPIFLGLIVLFFAMAARPNILRRIVEPISRLFPGKLGSMILHVTEEFIAGLECLRSPADLLGTVVCSYVSWMIEAGAYYLVAIAFDLPINYLDTLLVVGVVNLAGLIPASPGQIGVFQFFVSAVLIAEGVSAVPASAYSIVAHVVIWLPVTLIGFYFLARQGLGWNAVTHARDLAEEPKAIPSPATPLPGSEGSSGGGR